MGRERGKKLWDAYLTAAKGKRMTIKPGDKLPLEGADLTFVAARSRFIEGGSAAANPHCNNAELKEDRHDRKRQERRLHRQDG